jgi:hypothetical protein
MKLFTKEIDKKLFQQYPYGSDLESQKVVAKIFNPYGRGVWYIINSDPNDPDYLWAIVDLFDVEMGSVSRSELESIKVPPFGLHLERDSGFRPVNALELFQNVQQGKRYADGGVSDVEVFEKEGKAYITPAGSDKNKPVILFEDGGNLEMLKSQAVQFKHHADELSEVLKKNPQVHAWVVAKSERASSDLSDITHYLEGMTSKMANGGQLSMFNNGGGVGFNQYGEPYGFDEGSDIIYEWHYKEEDKQNPYKVWDKIDGVYVADFPSRQRAIEWIERNNYGYSDGGELRDYYVVVGEKKDGYWTVLSRPVHSKKIAQILLDSTTVSKGENNKIVTLSEARSHKKIIGEQYLTDEMIAKPSKYATGGNILSEDTVARVDDPAFSDVGQYSNGGEVGKIGGLDVYEAVYLYVKKALKHPFREEYLKPIGLYNTDKAKEVEESLKKKGYLNSAGAITESGKNKAKEIDNTLKTGISSEYIGTMRSDRKQKFEILKDRFEKKYASGGATDFVNDGAGMFAGGGVTKYNKFLKEFGNDKDLYVSHALKFADGSHGFEVQGYGSVDLEKVKARARGLGYTIKQNAINPKRFVALYSKNKAEARKVVRGYADDSPYEYAKGGGIKRKDLFETPNKIPKKVSEILDRYWEEKGDDMDYEDTGNMLKEVEAVGYTFDYGLDNEPMGLRPIGVDITELDGYEKYAGGGGVDDIDESTLYEWAKNIDDESLLSWCGYKNKYDFEDSSDLTYNKRNLILTNFEDLEYVYNNQAEYGLNNTGKVGDKEYKRVTSGELLDSYNEGYLGDRYVEVYNKNGEIYFVKYSKENDDEQSYGLLKLSKKEAIDKGWLDRKVKDKYAGGGNVKKKTTFNEKVASIKAKLLKNKKVPKAVQKDYGKTFSPAEAEDSAKRIAGAMRKKEMRNKK